MHVLKKDVLLLWPLTMRNKLEIHFIQGEFENRVSRDVITEKVYSVCVTTFSERYNDRVIDICSSYRQSVEDVDQPVLFFKMTVYTNCENTRKLTVITNFLRTKQYYSSIKLKKIHFNSFPCASRSAFKTSDSKRWFAWWYIVIINEFSI